MALAEHAVLLLLYSPSAHVVQVASSVVFSVLTPAVNLSVMEHVFSAVLPEHAWAVLVPVLYVPSAQPVHAVSSESIVVSIPGSLL